MSFQMYVPTRILFGKGQLEGLQTEPPGQKAMIVISNGKSTKRNWSFAKDGKELKLAGAKRFCLTKIMPNPLKQTIMEGAAFAKENPVILLSLLAAAVLWMHQSHCSNGGK